MDGIHHLYAHTVGAQRLTLKDAINIVVTPSQCITTINVRVDIATRGAAGRPYLDAVPALCLPMCGKFRHHCKLAPTDP